MLYGDSQYLKDKQRREAAWVDEHMRQVRAEKERLEREGESEEAKKLQAEHDAAFYKGITSQAVHRVHTSR